MKYAKVENFWGKLGTSDTPNFDIYTSDSSEENVKAWLDEFELPVKEVQVEKEDEVEVVEVEIGDEVISVVKEDEEKLNEILSEKETLEGKLDSKKDEIKTLEERMDELEDKDIDAIVQDRLDLIDSVREHIPNYDASGKSTKEIKADLIKEVDEDFEMEEKSDEYINARFDGALKTLELVNSKSFGDNNLRFKKGDDKNSKVEEKKKGRLNLKK